MWAAAAGPDRTYNNREASTRPTLQGRLLSLWRPARIDEVAGSGDQLCRIAEALPEGAAQLGIRCLPISG